MNKFLQRSPLKELIDEDNLSFDEWRRCLRELNVINTYLGGHKITIRGLSALIHPPHSPLTIAEIGCGGGDNLKAICEWNRTKRLPLRYIGIDLNQACIDFAKLNCREMPDTQFIHADYRDVNFGDPPDIIFSSLFCHHFSEEQLTGMLRWLKITARQGFFINDLHRHPLAYHAIRGLTRLFSGSYLIRNDAPVSVLRGFRKREWEELLRRTGITDYSITWEWAFRHLIVVKNG